MRSKIFSEFCHPGPRAIVEHPHPQVGMINRLGSDDGALENVLVFVVGCD
jgi:hypothetical protein